MAKQKRHTAEEIVAKLRETDVELSKGVSVGQVNTLGKRLRDFALTPVVALEQAIALSGKKMGWALPHRHCGREYQTVTLSD